MGSRDVQARVTCADGLRLLLRGRLPERPRAGLLFVHGLGEHSGRYEEVFAALARRGWACWGPDLRGHGASEGVRGHVDRFDDYTLDVEAALRFARASDGAVPIVLVGHSMGGLVALRFLRRSPGEVEGAVLSSPGLAPHADLAPPAWKAGLARFLAAAAPRTRFATGIDPALLSRDPAVGRDYAADPLVGRSVTARWYVEMRRAAGDVLADPDPWRTPLLVMQAAADRLVDPDTTRRWAEGIDAANLELEMVAEAYHELFQEPDVEDRLDRMDGWLRGLGLHRRGTGSPPARSAAVGAVRIPGSG